MNVKRIKLLFIVLSVCGVIFTLSGCASNESSQWAKSSSPWDKPKAGPVAAPAAETYKADLGMPAETVGYANDNAELSYQTESVESFAPQNTSAQTTEIEMTAAAVMEEPVVDEVSIMDQPANFYTMQLMASTDIDRVITFAEKNQVSTQYVVPTDRDGIIWHVLLLDVYPDYSSAIAARDEVMPRLKNVPWIRSVGSVQKLMAQ